MFPPDLAWDDFENYAKTDKPVLIPVGSIEGHGLHLPLNTIQLLLMRLLKG
jgi:creatinine amidohydrolase/Fe(II)-dependent formamide hydrolase-like protein